MLFNIIPSESNFLLWYYAPGMTIYSIFAASADGENGLPPDISGGTDSLLLLIPHRKSVNAFRISCSCVFFRAPITDKSIDQEHFCVPCAPHMVRGSFLVAGLLFGKGINAWNFLRISDRRPVWLCTFIVNLHHGNSASEIKASVRSGTAGSHLL